MLVDVRYTEVKYFNSSVKEEKNLFECVKLAEKR